MKRSTVALLLGSSMLVGVVGIAGQAEAQTSTAPNGGSIETVVVTAEKRSEKLIDVPVSVTVVSAKDLEDLHAASMQDWAPYVPGLSVVSGGSAGSETLAIDGIPPLQENPEVVVYLNDTPLGSSSSYAEAATLTADLNPYDIDSIEVLRGPQGTLYGANAMGGAIKYVLKSPDLTEFSGEVGGEMFGIDGAGGPGGTFRAAINAPIIDGELGIRASVYDAYTPGYIDDIATGASDNNGVRQRGGRFALLWKPTSDFSVEVTALSQNSFQYNTNGVTYNPTTGQPFPGGGKLSNINPLPQQLAENLDLFDATVKWDLHWASLTSISSYQDFASSETADDSLAEGPLLDFYIGTPDVGVTYTPTVKKFTQEVRLASPSSDFLEWMIGGYYTNETEKDLQTVYAYTSPGDLAPGINPAEFAKVDSIYSELAAFGNLTWHVTSQFDLTGGARYAYNHQVYYEPEGGPLTGEPPGVALPNPAQGTSQQSVPTWMVSPNYHLDEDTMVYVRVATGYQPGGPTGVLIGIKAPATFNSSTLIDYEAGLKSTFLDGHASADLSAYYIDWSDIQVPIIIPGVGSLPGNGGAATSKGFDASTTYSPIDGLELGLNLSYTDAEMTNAVATLGTVAGAVLPGVPFWSGSFTFDYKTPIDERWNFEGGGGYRFKGSEYNAVEGQESGGLPAGGEENAFGRLDLHAGIYDGSWRISVYAKNVTNDFHLVGVATTYAAGFGTPVDFGGNVLQPRTIGISIDKSF
ncbi:MAG: TonB-dependent receptor plug domain-containing protein [Rhizomicrobium sp.]